MNTQKGITTTILVIIILAVTIVSAVGTYFTLHTLAPKETKTITKSTAKTKKDTSASSNDPSNTTDLSILSADLSNLKPGGWADEVGKDFIKNFQTCTKGTFTFEEFAGFDIFTRTINGKINNKCQMTEETEDGGIVTCNFSTAQQAMALSYYVAVYEATESIGSSRVYGKKGTSTVDGKEYVFHKGQLIDDGVCSKSGGEDPTDW